MRFNDLTVGEYKTILNYYKIPIPSNKKEMKRQAERVITDKLCGCIKQVAKKENFQTELILVNKKPLEYAPKQLLIAKGLLEVRSHVSLPKEM